MRINYAPNILMIQLKRFKTDGNIKIDINARIKVDKGYFPMVTELPFKKNWEKIGGRTINKKT